MIQKAIARKQTNEIEHNMAVLLRVLADENRLKILVCLATGQKCVCQLTEAIKISQNLMSHHLRILKNAGLIIDERRGRWVYYSLKEAVGLKALLSRMKIFCDCTKSSKC